MTREESIATNADEGGCEAMMVLMIEVLLISVVLGVMFAAIGSDRK